MQTFAVHFRLSHPTVCETESSVGALLLRCLASRTVVVGLELIDLAGIEELSEELFGRFEQPLDTGSQLRVGRDVPLLLLGNFLQESLPVGEPLQLVELLLRGAQIARLHEMADARHQDLAAGDDVHEPRLQRGQEAFGPDPRVVVGNRCRDNRLPAGDHGQAG